MGGLNNLLIALLKKHGYRAGFRFENRTNTRLVNNYQINRILVSPGDDVDTFSSYLTIRDGGE
jgi:hypothetical protein